ncbi:type IV pilus assembly protein PilP [Oceanospirillum multiglobuliferum]|nr:pilus assembly protein PilP [Oceanospirillum multiglobuliferum]SKA22644.1 type IV pilus assembly protein PilP [Oceanospirillum multiglobuliferum]
MSRNRAASGFNMHFSYRYFLSALVVIGLSLLALSACSPQHSLDELRNKLEQIKNRPSGNIEALPLAPKYQPESYTASALRNPFQLNFTTEANHQQKGSQQKPDLSRQKTELELLPLESFSMVGTIQFADEKEASALIQDAQGKVYKVTIGQHLGQDFGKILNVTSQAILLEEIVQDELGGWIKRPRQIKLVGSEQ